MSPARVSAFVLAGGAGTRLRPLTQHLPKPALPFAHHCRVIDFVLANLQHSGVAPVHVLLQYKPEALLQHLARHWPEVRPLMPALDFRGTADAVAQALQRVGTAQADVVAVLAADHVYRMDLRPMVDFHRQRQAGVTVAAVAVELEQARQFGVLEVAPGGRITGFAEKPDTPRPLPDDPGRALASMGNYLFEPGFLAELLAAGGGVPTLDFGRDIIPAAVARGRAWAYELRANTVPGLRAGEAPGYWRDVGTLQAYAQAQRDAAGPAPQIVLDNPLWPIPATLAAPAPVPAVRPAQAPSTVFAYSPGSAHAGS